MHPFNDSLGTTERQLNFLKQRMADFVKFTRWALLAAFIIGFACGTIFSVLLGGS